MTTIRRKGMLGACHWISKHSACLRACNQSHLESTRSNSSYNTDLAANYWKSKLPISCEDQTSSTPDGIEQKTTNSSRVFLPVPEIFKESMCTMKRRVTFEDYWVAGLTNPNLSNEEKFTNPSLQNRMGEWTTANQGTYRYETNSFCQCFVSRHIYSI